MNGRELSEALRAGRRVYGTAILSTSPRWPGLVRGLGLDFVFIDTEHVAIDRHQLSWMCQAYRAMAIAPIVRVPEPDPFLACMALDGGAAGVIFPYVESPAQAVALRGATRLRPLKGRRLRAFLSGQESLEPALADYLAERNAATCMVVNIESPAGMAALDEILAVPGLDAVLVGPHDLSCSLGIPEQYGHPRFDEAVRTIIAKARAAGVGVGIHFSAGIEPEIAWAKAGANFIIHSSDLSLFGRAMRADLATFKAALGDGEGATDGGEDAI